MGLMDKVKAQATQLAQQAQETARDSKAKFDQSQGNKRADVLLRNLGAAVYAERTGRGSADSAAQIDKLVADISAHEAENGISLTQSTDQGAAARPANAVPGEFLPGAGQQAPASFTDPGAGSAFPGAGTPPPAPGPGTTSSFPGAGTTTSFPGGGTSSSFPDAGAPPPPPGPATPPPAPGPGTTSSFPDAGPGSTAFPGSGSAFPDTGTASSFPGAGSESAADAGTPSAFPDADSPES